MTTQKSKMTIEGYNEQIKILEELKQQFQENEKSMTRAFKNSAGDGAHDNAEFEELLNIERVLVNQINRQTEKIKNIEIIEIEKLDYDQINIGDTVRLNAIFAEDDVECIQLTLVGEDGKPEEDKISINCPLGNAIFKRRIGETVSYSLANNKVSVEILGKVNEKKASYAKTK